MNSYFEIRPGRGCKMYTLYHVTPFADYFMQNLSIDIEKAKVKAATIAGSKNYLNEIPINLKPIARGEDVLRFGRYKDLHVYEIEDDKYLLYLHKGAAKLDNETGIWFRTMNDDHPIVIAATNILMEKEILVEYEGKVITKQYRDAILASIEKNKQADFVGAIGDKIKIDVVVEKDGHFESAFGVIYWYQFRDEHNNIFYYKGNCLRKETPPINTLTGKVIESKDWKNLIQVGVDKGRLHTIYDSNISAEDIQRLNTMDFKSLDISHVNKKTLELIDIKYFDTQYLAKGVRCTVSGTIKSHDTYQGVKQNIIQRVKIS